MATTGRRPFDLPLAAAAAVLLLLGLAAWLTPEDSPWAQVTQVLWGAVPAAWAFGHLAFYRNQPFRLFCTRVWFSIAGREVKWGLVAEYDLAEKAASSDEAIQLLKGHLREGDRLVQEEPEATVFMLRGHAVTARLLNGLEWDGATYRQLRIEWLEHPRSLRVWPQVLNREATPILGELEKALEPKEAKYTIRTRFQGGNPYFGLFVENRPEIDVRRFSIEMVDYIGNNRVTIKVAKDSVELVSFNLNAIREVALQYMTLGTVGGDGHG